MTVPSIYYTILQSVQAAINGLALTGIPNTQVVIRKLPRAEETLDTLPIICVAPRDEPEQVEQASFANEVFVNYWVDVAIIAANNHDYLTNLDQYLAWREMIRRAFQRYPLTGATTVWRVELHPLAPLDPEAVNLNYDYSGLSVKFVSIEQATN